MALTCRVEEPSTASLAAVSEALLDHGVRACKQQWRDSNALGLCALEVDDQLELVGRLDRQVGRISALENAINIGCGAAVLVVEINAVDRKPAVLGAEAKRINRR